MSEEFNGPASGATAFSGATVFADANANGLLDLGEASVTTDANGIYRLAASAAPLILTGGINILTRQPFAGTLLAPGGSSVITPLTTLVQKVAAHSGGDLHAAQQMVAAALGLQSNLDLTALDPIAATRMGVAGAAQAFVAASMILDIFPRLDAAGVGGDDAFDGMAAWIAEGGHPIDPADPAGSPHSIWAKIFGALSALVSLIAAAATASPATFIDIMTKIDELPPQQGKIVKEAVFTAFVIAALAIALAPNHQPQAQWEPHDPVTFLKDVAAIIVAAHDGEVSAALAAAGSDPTEMAHVLAQYSGAALTAKIAAARMHVGGLGDSSVGGGEVPLKISHDDHGIELTLDGSNDVAGNWIRLTALDSGLKAGSTLLIYTVDAFGNLISRTDHDAGGDVTLEQATIATIGAATDDHGAHLLLGAQSVYLRAEEQLRFAVLSSNGSVDAASGADVTVQHDGLLQVATGGLHLTAASDNALSDAAELAETQRITGKPFVLLQQGETLTIELAGSAANTNTLGFVHVDIDAATGAWSVGGVAYDDSDAFTEAVRSHLDTGFLKALGGDFDTEANWTVAGATGYYAPVLLTTSGETFVIGNANAGGYEYIRMYGENTFGFEDLAYQQGSDFDYNDMVMRLTPSPDHFG